ncbi:hypothetical protein C8J57DRAFT_608534 [Mycena rebaudengoi]|nr:hypothetical protein C8J57DRAFT_608534 [Mycena rebaudengoi]
MAVFEISLSPNTTDTSFVCATMVQCALPECNEEGKSQCGRCKSAFYCGSDCQQKDWSTHKKQCKRPNATPASPPVQPVSPYGQVYNRFSGLSTPMSATADFFAPIFGYTAAHPKRVYTDLVNSYRILRLGAHKNAALVSAELQNIDFGGWMERVIRAGILPEWWDADVHRTGIDAYTREDVWGRLDRVVTPDEIRNSLDKPTQIMGLEMMVERIMNTT